MWQHIEFLVSLVTLNEVAADLTDCGYCAGLQHEFLHIVISDFQYHVLPSTVITILSLFSNNQAWIQGSIFEDQDPELQDQDLKVLDQN